ncbi:MAG: hypothetical protein KDI36_18960, partial [Pseudomonadales bacterium]|nr:hypothetical protein [Pseudomonadales bacterium]
MRLQLKFIESRGVGQEISLATFDGQTASIGRGTDQTIQIPDRRLPLNHSKLTLSGGKLNIASDYRFSVNDESARRAVLEVDDVIGISGHEIRVLAGTGEYDYVLEITLEAEQVEKLRDRFQTRLRETGIPERGLSWALFLTILIATLVIPMFGVFSDMSSLKATPGMPDDGLWLSGELHQTHAFMGQDCSYCHAIPFTPTRDEECLYCHLSVNHHFDTKVFGRDYQVGDRCADCHKEHSETASITRDDQESCTACHADLQGIGFDSDRLKPVSDFLNDHPDFMVTLTKYGPDEQWHDSRLEIWEDEAFEESNLLFPHDVHVSKEGIDSPEGPVILSCADCHTPDSGGKNMLTVNMEQHCASCHQLTFDPATPDRVVPHGSPPELMQTLREYYALQFLNQGQPEPATDKAPEVAREPARTSRRPGRSERPKVISDIITETRAEKGIPLTSQARLFIEARVEDAAANLFEKQTCTICHQITAVADEQVPWKVLPVHLTSDWYPMAVFSHDSHKNMQCEGCHEASVSASAEDILMTDIGTCRQCHGGEHSERLLQSNCITCHEFHLDSQNPMGELVEIRDLERQESAAAETEAVERMADEQ